ncbi:tRNA(Glu)-specific nuclease WapA precursor [compost metagenome]
MTTFEATVSSVFEDASKIQITKVQKPQFNDRDSTGEIIDPVSGSLTRKENLITLPGRDGLDLDVGIIYNSNNAVPFRYSEYYSDYWGMWERDWSYATPDLGAGWSFQFPSVIRYGNEYVYYDDGKGNMYKVGSDASDELSNYTKLLNYKGMDKRFVFDNAGIFSNGTDTSWAYLEYSDQTREYYNAVGKLIGMVDRFGNTIIYNYDGSGKLSSITDTVGRVVTFSYENSLNTTGAFDGEDIDIRVYNGATETQKVTLTKDRILVDLPNAYVPAKSVYVPVLSSITDQLGERTNFSYQNDLTMYSYYGFNFYALPTQVSYTHSTTNYEYGKVTRNIGSYESVAEYRVSSRIDHAGAQGYQQINYTYDGNYTGNTPDQYPGNLPSDFRFSTTSTVASNTASNGLRTTNTFDKDGRVLRTETVAGNNERKVTSYTAYHSKFTQSPTQTTIAEYGPGDSDETANHLYTETTYNDWGLVQSQTNPLTAEQFNNTGIKQHHTTTYQYEPTYRFLASKSSYLKETDASPVKESYTYTGEGRYKAVTNALGESTAYFYEYTNGLGAISQETAETISQGRTVAKKVTKYGPEYNYAYPTEQQQWFNIDKPDQKIVKTTMTYDPGTGLLKSQSDANGQTTQYDYDVAGRLKKETHPVRTNTKGEQYTEVIDYNYYNQTSTNFDAVNAGTQVLKVDTIKTVTNQSNGNTMKTYANTLYNGLGLALLEEHYDEYAGKWVFTQYHYDDQGSPIYQRDDLGNIVTVGYDVWGRENRATDTYGNVYVSDYDLKQRKSTSYMVASDTQEQLNYLETAYDPWGRATSKRTYKDWPSQSQPITESYQYDISGNVIGYTDPMNHQNDAGVTTVYNYDALNRLISVQDALNQTTRYTYDGTGQITKVTVQAKGGTEQTLNTKSYNEIGLPTTKQDGSSQTESLSYNSLGQLSSRTDRNGSVFSYSYDESGQQRSMTVSGTVNNAAQTQSSELVFGSTSPSYQTTNQYTNDKLQSMQQIYVDSLNQVRSRYDVTYSSGVIEHASNISKQLDVLGRITQLNDYYLNFYVNYQYNKQRLDKVQTNGSSTLTNDASANVQYSYYANNLVKSITYPTLTDGSTLKTEYTYNKAMGWVETMTNSKGSNNVLSSFSYGYDNNGNIVSTSEVRNNGAVQKTSYDYDALNRLISIMSPDGGSTTYTYDVRGNRQTLSDTSSTSLVMLDTSYTYDLFNTLTSVTKNGTISFKYYADGLRYLKNAGTISTQVNYDFNGQVITEEKLSGGYIVQQSNYVRGDRLLVKKDKKAAKDYYYLYNGHGDVVQIVDTSGKLVNSYSYDAWGNLTSQTVGTFNSFMYAGEMYDSETGFYYLRARYYDPSTGRFLNEDTVEGQIDNPLTLNLYTYVINNPLLYHDPSGNMHEEGSGGVGGGGYVPASGVSITYMAKIVAQGIYYAAVGTAGKILSPGAQKASTFNPTKYPWSDLPTTGDHPFVPPVDKAGNPIYKKGDKGGALDQDGNEWVQDKTSTKVGNDHWDVQHKNGKHTNVNGSKTGTEGAVNHGDDNFPKVKDKKKK